MIIFRPLPDGSAFGAALPPPKSEHPDCEPSAVSAQGSRRRHCHIYAVGAAPPCAVAGCQTAVGVFCLFLGVAIPLISSSGGRGRSSGRRAQFGRLVVVRGAVNLSRSWVFLSGIERRGREFEDVVAGGLAVGQGMVLAVPPAGVSVPLPACPPPACPQPYPPVCGGASFSLSADCTPCRSWRNTNRTGSPSFENAFQKVATAPCS